MTHKSIPHLIVFNAVTVVRYTDKLDATLFDFYSDRTSPRVHGVFHQFFHHARRPLHHFSRSDFINCCIIKHMNFRHIRIYPFPNCFKTFIILTKHRTA